MDVKDYRFQVFLVFKRSTSHLTIDDIKRSLDDEGFELRIGELFELQVSGAETASHRSEGEFSNMSQKLLFGSHAPLRALEFVQAFTNINGYQGDVAEMGIGGFEVTNTAVRLHGKLSKVLRMVKKLPRRSPNQKIQELREFLEGALRNEQIPVIEHFVDCDGLPTIPKNLRIEEHKKRDHIKLDISSVHLSLSLQQMKRETEKGDELRKLMAADSPLNANVLDYLLAHTELIPEEWKKDSRDDSRCIYFWGTIYGDAGPSLYVRYLYFKDRWWYSSFKSLNSDFGPNEPAAVWRRQ